MDKQEEKNITGYIPVPIKKKPREKLIQTLEQWKIDYENATTQEEKDLLWLRIEVMTKSLQREKVRGFEEVAKEHKKYDNETILPVRADKGSAGSDFFIKEQVTLEPGESKLVFTDVKAYMQEDEVLLIYIRSSLGVKFGINLKNGTGVIDSSYYSNPTNDGNIGIPLVNMSRKKVVIEAGERVAQGVFTKYLVTDNDEVLHEERTAGFGSSNRV
jgi:dUTP pyrophosphatase